MAEARWEAARGLLNPPETARRATERRVLEDTLTTAIVEGALDAIVTIDASGRIGDFNAQAERTFGYSRLEAIGAEMAELIIPEGLRAAHRAGLARVVEGGASSLIGRRIEMTALRADGTEFPVELTISRLDLPDRHPLFIGFIRDIEERRRTEEELHQAREFRQLVLEHTLDVVMLLDEEGAIVYASPSFERILGHDPASLLGTNVLDLIHPDDILVAANGLANTITGETVFASEVRVLHAEGRWVTMEGINRGISSPERPPLVLASARDVTERKQSEEALLRLAAIVESSDDAIYSKALDGTILTWNQGAERLFGYAAEDILGRPVAVLSPLDSVGEMQDIMERLAAGERIEHLETVRIRRDGTRVDVSLTISPIRDRTGTVVAASIIARDITERKRAEAQIAFLAYHDKLTGLPNRAKFEELLGMALARARRHRQAVAVLYLDLDDFKLINDSLGHSAGDDLLVQVAARLAQASRETDVVARMGGDEFLILLSDLPMRDPSPRTDPHADAAAAVAAVTARIHDHMRRPFTLSNLDVYVTASIGVSIFPVDALEGRHLLANADVAMYRSKRGGPGRTTLFTTDPASPGTSLSLMTRLRQAVKDHAWRLEFQPIVELATGRVVSVESLIRWDDPELGSVPPDRFIPLAEETGLIDSIGDWVVDELLGWAKQWSAMGLSIDVGLNVSPRQLWGPELVDRLQSRVESAGVDPRTLVMEITESAAMTDAERTLRALRMLSGRGFRFALDDFGKGHSSLARLTELPIDVIKVDRSFVRDVCDRADAATLVRAITQLALSLEIVPLAEGVETEEQCRFLIDQGCVLGQGFYFSRPVPPERIPSLVARGFEDLIGPR